MDIILIILGIVCLLLGMVGCFLPVLPGPPLSYLGLLLLHWTEQIHFSTTSLLIWLLLVIVVQILDYISPVLGTKYAGGSKWGNRGCIIGTVAGLFVFPPWGILIGPFVGAVIGELISGKQSVDAVQAGLGAFLGFLFSVVAKESLCGYFLYCFVVAFI
ncbi:MAG: DUF456 family protein [Parabacteroides distasonis]|nr:DUF456 family protein [Parabacteroides distasonis]